MANNHSDEEEESGEEMEVSSPGNDTESESEPEPDPAKPPAAAPKKPEPQHSSSSTEEESESESEPEPEPEPKTQKPNLVVVKPIASKPMNDPKKSAAKPRSKPDATAKLTSPKKSTAASGAKRPVVDDGEAKGSKKSKKKPEKEVEIPVKKTAATEDVKRQLFQRLWSEDDEIAILKGMIDYRSKKKADPVADLSAFHEFIKKSLHVEVSKAQLQDKIRRLKKKYVNNAGKEKKGKERSFSKAHDQKAYDLSKKIWGKEKSDNKGQVEVVKAENLVASMGKKDSGVKDNGVLVEAKEEKQSVMGEKTVEATPNLSLISFGGNVAALEKWLEENSGVLSKEKRDELKEKWEALKVAEAGLCLRRMNLLAEQGELVREAMRASGIEI